MYSMWPGGISVLLGWQHSLSRSSPRWELLHLNQKILAGKCFQQDIIFSWNFLPIWVQDTSAKSCPLQWKETGEDVPHCDGLQQLWYEHWCRLLCLGFAVLSFWLPVWVLCPSLAGILFAASHSSSQIKVESLLPHPMLKWNVLCKSFAFPWAETLFYLSHQERELLQPHCPTTCGVSDTGVCSKGCVLLCYRQHCSCCAPSFFLCHLHCHADEHSVKQAPGIFHSCWRRQMLLADTREACAVVTDLPFLAINKNKLFFLKKVLLGYTCFSKDCVVGGKQMVSHKKWMGGRMQACGQACPWCCVPARAFAVPVRPGLPPSPGYQRCCAGFSLWLVPLRRQSPLFLPALACALGRAAQHRVPLFPCTAWCSVPKWRCPSVPCCWLCCLPCPSAVVPHLCQPPQDGGVCCVSILVLLVWWGTTGCWSVWKTRGLPPCCPPHQREHTLPCKQVSHACTLWIYGLPQYSFVSLHQARNLAGVSANTRKQLTCVRRQG